MSQKWNGANKDVRLKSSHPCDNGYLTCIAKNARPVILPDITYILPALIKAQVQSRFQTNYAEA